jgi:rhodanese-related sulfurtransferase
MVKITCAVDEIKSLTPDEVRAIMNQDKAGEYLILDVRQPQEYQSGHIPGATLIPLGELEARQ